jgi:diguanylate cyclase (GGDEF)-like protein
LLYLDVDRFKWVNDTLGHPAGDELIRAIAQRLAAVVRASDTVARLGGDEFAILQTDVMLADDLHKLCERIIDAVTQPFDLIGSHVFVGMSIGVARAGTDGLERTELARKADIALYHAKGAGRGRYSIFAETMDATIQARQSVESDLRLALQRGNELQLHYQPQYDAAAKSVVGFEALVRWMHPTKGLMPPAMFVPIAEECGLIEQLGAWVLTEACTAARAWPVATIAVNVSAVQLRNASFPEQVLATLAATGLEATRLELEITETAFMTQVGQCEANLKALRSMGVRIALDDFGTGYSSFSHLRDFAVDRVKIDRSFITGIEDAGSEAAIVEAIVNLARASGLKITAEGVETLAQSDFLCSVGCDELQGFLLSRPLITRDVNVMFGIAPCTELPMLAA